MTRPEWHGQRLWPRESSPAEEWISNQEAFVLAYSGRLREARQTSQRAVALARQSGRGEMAALYETGAALREAFLGSAPAARRTAIAAHELSRELYAEYGAAFALALSGDSARSQTLANDLERRFPEDTAVRFSYLPALRARLALNHGEPARAIELLQTAVPYELGTPPSSFFGFFGALYPVYVRGEAYLAAHQGAAAATESGKSSATAASSSAIPLARWRTSNSAGPWPCPAIAPGHRQPTRIS